MDNQEQAQTINTEGIAAEGQQAQTPELSISDLQNVRAIVDTAVRRGAFAAGEMSAVGAVYDRLNTFLNSVAPPQKTETPSA
jgi:hypothetical protein